MSDKVWEMIDANMALIREVIASAEGIAADLSGNADNRIRGGFMLVEEARVRRLLKAVDGLNNIHLPA